MPRLAPIASAVILVLALAALALLARRIEALRPALEAGAAAQVFERGRAAAERLIEQARARGHLWLDTRRWLEDAVRARHAGDADEAHRLLERATAEARLALEQAGNEARRYAQRRRGEAP